MSDAVYPRLFEYPFELVSELKEAANEHGYRIGPDQASGWFFFRSASAPGEIALAGTSGGLAGPFLLSVFHPGAARELAAPQAVDCAKGAAASFVLADRSALRQALTEVYRLSVSLPTLPLESYLRDIEGLGDTEAERAYKVRIGQDRFREAQLSYWHSCCPLTGITEPELLRASHIVPWAKCESDAERLNVHNGFLLSSLWDAAFDSGLISFEDDGAVLISPQMKTAARKAINFQSVTRLPLQDEHRSRLQWHRTTLFRS
jgi:putative restriction endonuclease